MRDNTDIALEIDKLKKYRPLIPPKTSFGDDNLVIIDAEIKVLEKLIGLSSIYKEFESDDDPERRIVDAAIDAYNWKMGASGVDSPSSQWYPLVSDKLTEPENETEPENKTEPEKADGWYCPSCEKGWEDTDDLMAIYECGSCGSTFNKDGSADGDSNRCPDCNKFAAKSSDHGCPECGDIECEEGRIVKDEDGEWKMAEDEE